MLYSFVNSGGRTFHARASLICANTKVGALPRLTGLRRAMSLITFAATATKELVVATFS
jgi:hypothetical protein